MKDLRFYDNLFKLYENESTPKLKEKYWDFSIKNEDKAILFRDWFFQEQKFYRLDNEVYVTTDSEKNLSLKLKELEIAFKKIGKSILDYDTAEELIAAIKYELEENGDERTF